MGAAAAPETIAVGFFPRRAPPDQVRGARGSSRARRSKKARRSGPPLTLRPCGFRAPGAPMDGPPSQGMDPGDSNRRQIMPAIGYVTRQTNSGGYKGQLKSLSIRADIDIVPNNGKSADNQPDFRVLTRGYEIGAGWLRTGETSGKEYVSLSLAAPEFGPRKLYANLGRAAGQDDEDMFAVIWNPAD